MEVDTGKPIVPTHRVLLQELDQNITLVSDHGQENIRKAEKGHGK